MTKLDQHVNEMMATAGKKFKNFLWSRFLIIVQNVNMIVNGKCNSRLNPSATSTDLHDNMAPTIMGLSRLSRQKKKYSCKFQQAWVTDLRWLGRSDRGANVLPCM